MSKTETVSSDARCYWLGAKHHCPKVDAQKCPEHNEIRKSRQRAGSLQIHTSPHTSSGSQGMIERGYFSMSL